jgi:hypothetical protein
MIILNGGCGGGSTASSATTGLLVDNGLAGLLVAIEMTGLIDNIKNCASRTVAMITMTTNNLQFPIAGTL